MSLVVLVAGSVITTSGFAGPLTSSASYSLEGPGPDMDLIELPLAAVLVFVALAVFLSFAASLVVARRWLLTSYGLTALGVASSVLAFAAAWFGTYIGDVSITTVAQAALWRLGIGLALGVGGLFLWWTSWEPIGNRDGETQAAGP